IMIGWSSPTGSYCTYDDIFGDGSTQPIPCPPDTSGGPYKVTGTVTITKVGVESYTAPVNMADRKRHIIITPDITGSPGERFTLDIAVTYNGETTTYHSETVMLRTPAITHTSYVIRKGDVGKNDSFVPLISFSEPQDEKNYYLFGICEVDYYGNAMWCGNTRVWPYSIIDDKFLPAAVKGLSIDDGATVAKYAQFYPDPPPGGGVQVNMYSINAQTYNFYKILLDQFNNDGGAYSPTPATPPGNISGDAIGLFRAIHKSSGVVMR
ncbi:MAG TPA: DUF4249 family protein, partial [Chryseosolibacter sp.]|nr:DUF4249 family protein [Chryseosolibacter sp.]